MNIIAKARNVFKSKPLLSNCLTYGSLYAGAEFSQQTIIRKILVSKKLRFTFKILITIKNDNFRLKKNRTMTLA